MIIQNRRALALAGCCYLLACIATFFVTDKETRNLPIQDYFATSVTNNESSHKRVGRIRYGWPFFFVTHWWFHPGLRPTPNPQPLPVSPDHVKKDMEPGLEEIPGLGMSDRPLDWNVFVVPKLFYLRGTIVPIIGHVAVCWLWSAAEVAVQNSSARRAARMREAHFLNDVPPSPCLLSINIHKIIHDIHSNVRARVRETLLEESQALFATRFFAKICMNIDKNIWGLELLSICGCRR